MLIRIKKEEVPILECTRVDGSVTWGKIQPAMVAHDLAHYLTETALGYTQAFYGLLSQGWNISDFEKPREKRPTPLLPSNLPHEALITEHIVNMLMVSLQSDAEITHISASLTEIVEEAGFKLPSELDLSRFLMLRSQLKELLEKWHALPIHANLEFNF